MASCWQVGRSSKNASKLLLLQYFWLPRPSNFEAKFNKKRTQTDRNSSENLVSILIEFLMDFGGQLGSKILPKPGQNRGKSMKDGLPNQWKFCMLSEGSLSGSWRATWLQNPSKMVPGGIRLSSRFRTWKGLGGVLGPLGAQELILVDFCLIFERFW